MQQADCGEGLFEDFSSRGRAEIGGGRSHGLDVGGVASGWWAVVGGFTNCGLGYEKVSV